MSFSNMSCIVFLCNHFSSFFIASQVMIVCDTLIFSRTTFVAQDRFIVVADCKAFIVFTWNFYILSVHCSVVSFQGNAAG